MKKLIAVILTVLLALMLCEGVLAENDAESLYDRLVDLLFYTDNVTMEVKAEFSLDGEWFKTAEGVWKQDRDRSWRQLILTAPKMDGTTLQNGYTIVAAGNQINIMEVYFPGTFKIGTAISRDSILRRTVETEQLIRLGSVIASQADLLLGNESVTKTNDREYRISLNRNISLLADAALNQLARFAAKRYFGIDDDLLSMDNMPSVYYYTTLTEGLLYCMRNISLRSAEATLNTDENGDILQAEGEVSLNVETAADGILQLDIRFDLETSDRGSTMVRKFDPEDYDMLPAEDQEVQLSGHYLDSAQVDELQAKAEEIWRKAGYDMRGVIGTGYHQEDGFDVVTFDLKEGKVLWTYFNQEGTAVWLNAEPRIWLNIPADYPDEKTDEQLKAFMLGFLKDVNPERAETVNDLKMEFRYRVDGYVFEEYNEYPLNQDDDGVLFVVRTGPEPRIEYFTTISNG